MNGQNRGAARASRPFGIAVSGGVLATFCCVALLGPSGTVWADPCVVPDDTTGTVSLPPDGCEYLSPDEVHMIMANLPAGTEIILDTIHLDFICKQGGGGPHCGTPGGPLGGEQEFFQSNARLHITGTGGLSTFSRTITVPLVCMTVTGPRNPGDAVQDFDTEMVQLQGSIFGDPDFDFLTITGGTGFGLPSPGHTTLTRLGSSGSDFVVDSFFDIEYQIDFQGAAGSVLQGAFGVTQGTLRMEARGPGACPPLPDGSGCSASTICPVAEPCSPACVNFDPATGRTIVTDCQCRDPNMCQVDISGARGVPAACVIPEGPPGTVTLPPAGCDYLSPEEVHEILNNLPAGTTIELAAIHKDFICKQGPTGPFPGCPPPGICEDVGGGQGGHVDCFQSTLELNITGTGALGTFSKQIFLPAQCRVDTGPRNPGDPVQDFDNEMVQLQGDLFGDPDFASLNVRAGSGFGLPPSMGHTTLTDLGNGTFNVDSFFDIIYTIDFQGAVGGALDGLGGSTTGILRMATGSGGSGSPPGCIGGCPAGTSCVEATTVRADGTIDICCDCVPHPSQCQPLPDGSGCEPVACTDGVSDCNPSCVTFDPATGQTTVDACACVPPGECHVAIPGPAGVPCASPAGGNRGSGNTCVVTPVGGTVELPPANCGYQSPEDIHKIIDGLPAGTTIEIGATHDRFFNETRTPGGTLGGEIEQFDSILGLELCGTGVLGTFTRTVQVQVGCEVHTAPRTAGDAVQSFETDMFRLQGQISGDPDFALLKVTAGTAFGLPSPGHTILTELPGGNFVVDSFFDITYQIEYVGAVGGQLDGLSGMTEATVRMGTGDVPRCEGGCPVGEVCEEIRTVNGDGTVSLCCNCVPEPPACVPTADGSACENFNCPAPPNEECLPRCVKVDPLTGVTTVIDCDCRGATECHVDLVPGAPGRGAPPADPCVVADVGGTVTLPPEGCEYLTADQVHEILDGLPAGVTIELDAIHKDIACGSDGVPQRPWCPPPGLCEDPADGNGALGGRRDCFDSTLELSIDFKTNGIPFFHRDISIGQVACAVHTAPRNVGDAVQDFDTVMFDLQGQLGGGDPDFASLVITAGDNNGLPSPGHTTLTQLPGGQFAVDSFFDITYRIDFVGTAAGVLNGASGSTTATVRMQTGTIPDCDGVCPAGTICEKSVVVQSDGTIDVCCDCVPDLPQCQPLPDGSACEPFTCTDGVSLCNPSCATVDPLTGVVTITECDCRGPNECQVDAGTSGAARVAVAGGDPCVVPPGPPGTITLPPPGCEYLSPEEVHEILDGLPAGATIELAPIHKDFICDHTPGAGFPGCPPAGVCEEPGGTLGGQVDCFQSNLELTVNGTGPLAGFNSFLSVPIDCQVHTGPRNPGDAVQDFDTDMYFLQGELFGDPDFCVLKITGGTGFGLPGAGHTTLTELPSGDFAVDSFFDITYQIDYVGCPGGALPGLSGTTTATLRMATGSTPSCVGGCPAGEMCEEIQTVNADGTISVCCNCVPEPQACLPTTDGLACENFNCPAPPSEECLPRCVKVDPLTGITTVVDCDCRPVNECHVDLVPGAPGRGVPADACVVTDVGGTVTLPPEGCEYLTTEQVHEILDGLPAGTTIELAAIHKDIACKGAGSTQDPWCPPVGLCEDPADGNGSLGGRRDCFDSTLELSVDFKTNGIPYYHRDITIGSVACAVHTAPRTPGDPVQEFDTDMFRLEGQLGGGDPDFASLVITAGTDLGLPSPGHTTLTRLGPPGSNFAVDSFFDITYRIDYVGTAAGVLNGATGSTTATVRMRTGTIPDCQGDCPAGTICEKAVVVQSDGTIDVCCDCVAPPTCDPTTDGLGCQPFVCPDPAVEDCQAVCVHFDAATGQTVVIDCECRNIGDCHVEMVSVGAGGGRGAPPGSGGCVAPDTSGGGTVNLPPPGCGYVSPNDFHLIIPDSVPAGTTIEVDASHHGFLCCDVTCPPPAPPPELCRQDPGRGSDVICNDDCTSEVLPGGNLGGEIERFDSILTLDMNGTGDLGGFSTNIEIAVACEVHTGPRTPGDPVQSFPNEMVQLQGVLEPGDPAFCSLSIIGGTNFGMPSPGQTTLVRLPSGDFNVDSFFDVTYQIDFVGCPGGPLDGMTGSTTGTLRMQTGNGATEIPQCVGNCPANTRCVESVNTFADGSFDMCCNCVPVPVATTWASCAVHDAAGNEGAPFEVCVSIADGGPGGACDPRADTTIEGRFFASGGTTPNFNRIEVTLDGPAAGAVSMEASCTDGNIYVAAPVTVSGGGTTVTGIFGPPLPNTHCCTLTLSGGASGSQLIKRLEGDVNGSGRVNATDKNIVKGRVTATSPPLTCDDLHYDVNMSGRINATDKNMIKGRITGTQKELNAGCP
ncbi:MAG: hypothetical protein GY778_02330 [bacterium]|nr:hypothetical protein [bacterium]